MAVFFVIWYIQRQTMTLSMTLVPLKVIAGTVNGIIVCISKITAYDMYEFNYNRRAS